MNILLTQCIEQTISEAINEEITIVKNQQLSGGDINQAYCLNTKNKKFFVKINQRKYQKIFSTEALALQVIARTKCIRVPEVICIGEFEEKSFLALEYIHLSKKGNRNLLARQLANMHLNSNDKFGFEKDNFIGTTPQQNNWNINWIEFFRDERLFFQWQLLRSQNLAKAVVIKFEKLLNKLPKFFVGYQPQIALLHGDLWQGNYAFDTFGKPVIYDPASYYGDHEADLAMMELFGHPGADFFRQYSQIFPIDAGYYYRKPLYNLYHIMNHANLFGGNYFKQLENRVDKLLKLICM